MILGRLRSLWDQSYGKRIAAFEALSWAAAPCDVAAEPLVAVFDVWPVVADQLDLVGGHEVVVAGKGGFGGDG
jgi:pyruvate dehydrogenase complex dehydrogenase (E1) component